MKMFFLKKKKKFLNVFASRPLLPQSGRRGVLDRVIGWVKLAGVWPEYTSGKN